MTPIVSPWIFYLISVLSVLSDLAVIVMIGAVIICVFFGISILDFDGEGSEDYKRDKRIIKKSIITFIIAMIMVIFIPSEDTCYKMFVASYITEDNIKAVGDTADELVDYIVDKVQDLQESD